jgi:ADP-ribosylglycohydrolase
MYGAILGDIIGSPFEFDRGDKTKNFDLFSEVCGFTDDSVMTIAVGEALLAVGLEAAVAFNMQDWEKDIHMQVMVEASDIGLKKKIQNHTEAMEMVQP